MENVKNHWMNQTLSDWIGNVRHIYCSLYKESRNIKSRKNFRHFLLNHWGLVLIMISLHAVLGEEYMG